MNNSKGLLFLISLFTLLFFINSTLSAEITEPIRDGDYIYIDDSKAYLKGPYSATHGEDIEHWAMTKQFTGDCDMAIGFDGEVAWPTKVLLEYPHYKYWNTNESQTFYYVTNFAPTTDSPDYGNWYNPLKYKFDHKTFVGYDNITNESIWQDVIGTVAYFDSQTNNGTNYTITWHTEHSRLEQYRDISDRILANPINYEFDGKNLWFVIKDIPMTAGVMRKIVIEMDGIIKLGEQSYKYDIIWKPSHQTIAEARATGNLYVLDPYLNVSYPFRVGPIYLNQSAISGTQNNFPLQYYKYLDVFNGYHPVVTVNGTRVPCENESYSNNNLSLFYKANISNVTNPEIYVYASPDLVAADSTYGSQAVWDSNFKAVWHFNQEPNGAGANTILDSTSNTKHATQHNFATNSLEDADYGKGIHFDDVNDYISFPQLYTSLSEVTTTIKFKSDVMDSTEQRLYVYQADGSYIIISINSGTGNLIKSYVNTWSSTTLSYSVMDWRIISTQAEDGISLYTFVDGNKIGVNVVPTFSSIGSDKLIGAGDTTPNSRADGIISEVRVSTIKRTDNYLSTEANNLMNPTATSTAPFYNLTGEIQYYADSLHYNSSLPYNFTVESDGTLTSNRSIVAGDDINDTAQSTGTSNLIVTNFDNAASIVRNFTISGDDLDWYQAANLSGSYSMKNSSGTIQTANDGNFTNNLVAGDYWIEQADISIILLSQTPSIIYTNTTGCINISYGITHSSSGLNNTSVSFIYRNYDYDLSDSNHSIRPPANDLASVWNFNGRILRAANRNETPGLNFENNDTITGGDTYTWSGLDENSTKLTIVPVNSTYTLVYINATVHCIMPQMWYLDRTDQQEATKTQLPIHKTSNVLMKFWNFEIYKGNYDFLGVGYTDTSLNSNPALWPSDANPVNFYYVNSNYNPATGGDPITSGYAVYMGSLNASGWVDHVYSPHTNSNYVRGFIDNNYLHTVINTTNISYLYFTSNTDVAKPYYINMTNVATSTNRTFANTNTLWAGGSYPLSSQLYTPNVWFAFMKLNMSLDHKLYAADNNNLWGSSSMNRTNITQALFPPTTPSFYAFHNEFQDVDMNRTYHDTIQIQVSAGSDPDGGVVTHNITLHYGNKTYVATINGSAVAEDGVYTNITFNTTPYYSQTEKYTLRLIATDDESETVTVWLNTNFSLDGTPRIISYSPDTPVSSSEGENQTFSITTNLLGNVTWYLDSVEVFNETDVNSSSYSDDNASLGLHNVTVITTNVNGSNSMMWDWNVRTELWSLIEDSVAWGISVAQYLVSSIGIVIVTAFSLICILILMMLIGAALSVTKIIYR